jgi:hypothetical protein
MESWTLFGTRFITGETNPRIRPDNDNFGLKEDWVTPAEFMQWVKRTRDEMRRELQADPALWQSPKHRRQRTMLNAMEQYALWHYYRVREG